MDFGVSFPIRPQAKVCTPVRVILSESSVKSQNHSWYINYTFNQNLEQMYDHAVCKNIIIGLNERQLFGKAKTCYLYFCFAQFCYVIR